MAEQIHKDLIKEEEKSQSENVLLPFCQARVKWRKYSLIELIFAN